MKEYPIAHIIWVDPTSIDPWTHIDDIEPHANYIHSYGIIVKENNQVIALALNLDKHEDNASCITIIPKSNIIEKRTGTMVLIKNEKENKKEKL